jgi:hypothetical protein
MEGEIFKETELTNFRLNSGFPECMRFKHAIHIPSPMTFIMQTKVNIHLGGIL